MSEPRIENQIDYVELPVKDMARTKQFYSAVFGWKFDDYGPDYTSFFDGRLAGGFTMERPVQSRIRTAGGSIVKETFSFPGGQRFHFADPNGNELAVWSDIEQ